MSHPYLPQLLALPADEREALAKLLWDSVQRSERIRLVPVDACDVELVRDCLELLSRQRDRGDDGLPVIEA